MVIDREVEGDFSEEEKNQFDMEDRLEVERSGLGELLANAIHEICLTPATYRYQQ